MKTELVGLPTEVKQWLEDNPSVRLTCVRDNTVIVDSFNTSSQGTIQEGDIAALALAGFTGAILGAAVGLITAKLVEDIGKRSDLV